MEAPEAEDDDGGDGWCGGACERGCECLEEGRGVQVGGGCGEVLDGGGMPGGVFGGGGVGEGVVGFCEL